MAFICSGFISTYFVSQIPNSMSCECRDLIEQCLQVDAKKRIALRNIPSHPFLNKIIRRSSALASNVDSGHYTLSTNNTKRTSLFAIPEAAVNSHCSQQRGPVSATPDYERSGCHGEEQQSYHSAGGGSNRSGGSGKTSNRSHRNRAHLSHRSEEQMSHRSGEQMSHRSGEQMSHRSGEQMSHRSGEQMSHRSGEQMSHRSGEQMSHRSGEQMSHRSGGGTSERNGSISSYLGSGSLGYLSHESARLQENSCAYSNPVGHLTHSDHERKDHFRPHDPGGQELYSPPVKIKSK